MALVLAAAVAVGAASSASRPRAAARGYARLLPSTGPMDRASDCLMATVLLRSRAEGRPAIPETQFQALRDYCRVANDAAPPDRSTTAGTAATTAKAPL